MPADTNVCDHARQRTVHVRHRVPLAGGLMHIAEIKVLLPADQRIVGSPEGNIVRAVVQDIGDGRQLLILR